VRSRKGPDRDRPRRSDGEKSGARQRKVRGHWGAARGKERESQGSTKIGAKSMQNSLSLLMREKVKRANHSQRSFGRVREKQVTGLRNISVTLTEGVG